MEMKSIQAGNLLKNQVHSPLDMFQIKEPSEEEKTKQINRITAKLKAGKRLTAQEKAFLQKYAPALYQTAKKVELQREALKNQLEHAKSKEEANEIIGNALGGISNKDPDKEYIVAAIMDEEKEFKSSDAYKGLPATKEEAKKEKNKDNYHPYDRKKDKEDNPITAGLYNAKGEISFERM